MEGFRKSCVVGSGGEKKRPEKGKKRTRKIKNIAMGERAHIDFEKKVNPNEFRSLRKSKGPTRNEEGKRPSSKSNTASALGDSDALSI